MGHAPGDLGWNFPCFDTRRRLRPIGPPGSLSGRVSEDPVLKSLEIIDARAVLIPHAALSTSGELQNSGLSESFMDSCSRLEESIVKAYQGVERLKLT